MRDKDLDDSKKAVRIGSASIFADGAVSQGSAVWPDFAEPITHHISIMSIETIWLAIGFLGQGLFFGRWVVQWIASERKAESQVPISFWYMSLIGGLITLAYAIYRARSGLHRRTEHRVYRLYSQPDADLAREPGEPAGQPLFSTNITL